MITQNDSRYYDALLKISRSLNSTHDPERLFGEVMDIAMETMEAERGFLMIQQPGEGELVPAVARNIDTEEEMGKGSASHSVLQQVMETREPVMTHDAPEDDRFDSAESIISQQIQSILAVPLLIRGELRGVIYLDSRRNRTRFTSEGLRFMESFADQAALAIENASFIRQKLNETRALRSQIEEIYPFKEITGQSPAMQEVFDLMERVLDSDTPLLLEGESGTGKELVARAIHYQGARQDQPFVAQFCGALAETLLESELFGHKKGAFTGAAADKQGLFEIANGGTFFLDEIAEIPLNTQTKLLRVLQEGEIKRVGETQTRHVDVRIISASNKDLWEEVQSGNFREDLYYRINVITINLPPLRERGDDVFLLAEQFLDRYTRKMGKEIDGFTTEAMEVMKRYSWPGNVRELENTIQRAVTLCREKKIPASLLGISPRGEQEREDILTLEEMTQRHVLRVLEKHDGNRTHTAGALDVSLRWLQYKLKEWDEN